MMHDRLNLLCLPAQSRVLRSFGGCRQIAAVWCGLLATMLGSVACGQEDRDAAWQEFLHTHEIWTSWEKNISSVRVSGFEFFGVCDEATTETSRDAIQKMVETGVLPLVEKGVPTLEELKAVTQPLFVEGRDPAQSDRPRGRWRTFTLLRSGKQAIKESDTDGVRRVVSRSPDGEQQYNQSGNIGPVFPAPTGLVVEEVRDLAFHPTGGIPYDKDGRPAQDRFGKYRVTHLDDARSELASSFSRTVYDRRTGFVHDYHLHIPPIQRFNQRLQYLPVETAAGIPVPKVFVKLHFKKTTDVPPPVSTFSVFVINEVEINPSVAASHFHVAVPEGTIVQRYESAHPMRDSPSPKIDVATESVSDLSAFVDRPNFGQRAP